MRDDQRSVAAHVEHLALKVLNIVIGDRPDRFTAADRISILDDSDSRGPRSFLRQGRRASGEHEGEGGDDHDARVAGGHHPQAPFGPRASTVSALLDA